ncbi:S8 family serine peptidase [Halorarius halobius]|uniref:S8 family serine peptidase n=1 Tax=Halorarius halobius TaxID=2962671 RepID=UPI0020CE9942|nr:S8 family serine peptidase [Halorarius halobius]
MSDDSSNDIGRRSFMKAAGTVAGAGLLGVGTDAVGAAESGIGERFLNWRTVEAQKVWDRGYRGRPDRTVALTDSGVAARHPDLGPWNGILADIKDGSVKLADTDGADFTEADAETTFTTLETLTDSGTIGPGVADAGQSQRKVMVTFTPSTAKTKTDDSVDSKEANYIDANLTWTPQRADNELLLEKFVDGNWKQVGASTNFNPQTGAGETIAVEVDPDVKYRLVIETYINAQATYELTAKVQNKTVKGGDGGPQFTFESTDSIDPFADVPDDPTAADATTPKTVGWYDAGTRYGSFDRPRDPDGHGSHVASTMAGSGRASTVDHDNTTVHEPRTVLVPGDFIEYEVEVGAKETVFASGFGEQVKIEIVHDDEVVHTSPARFDSIIADEPAVHDSGTATYTVRVRPSRTQDAAVAAGAPVGTVDAPADPEEGTPTAGRIDEIAVGTYHSPVDAVGERVEDQGQAVHSGVAPNQSIVGLQGLSEPTADLAAHAETFADAFNIRAVNMSWGFLLGAPVGGAGGATSPLPSQIRNIAKGGILTVASAGNAITPANGNGSAAGQDEAISVVATGPFDGIASYSSGGLATVDESESEDAEDGVPVDRKPDVTAPGGDLKPDVITLLAGVSHPVPSYYELVRAALAPSPDESFEAGDPPRDFLSIGGTSMASPYTTGTAGLVAQAMEEDAPDDIALPEPAETGLEETLRLKQAILATASETPFTAAPYHNAKTTPHQPTYEHGGRDPYEGYGRVNPDAAVDAVSRPLVAADDDALVDTSTVDPSDTASATSEEAVGLYIPEDSRAVAGYLDLEDGDAVTVDIAHQFYSGGNKGMAKDAPWLDLFVYDAANPAENGEPNIVASVQGRQGSGSVSVSGAGTYYVVAKIVNVPGAVNGYDVRSNFELTVSYTAPALPTLSASGARSDDGSAFTAGQTNQVTLRLRDISPQVDDDATVELYDESPWALTEFGNDGVSRDPDTGEVSLGTVKAEDIKSGEVVRSYFVEAPSSSGQYTFGPASVEIDAEADLKGTTATYGGTETNVVVGTSTNPGEAGSTTTDL